VVREPGASIDEKTVIGALAEQLAKYKQPKRVLFVEELPRNTMGKVQKNLLRDRHAGLYAPSDSAGRPAPPIVSGLTPASAPGVIGGTKS
jgi:malonyl-CoA/methylmalonyl-CoA synthetase